MKPNQHFSMEKVVSALLCTSAAIVMLAVSGALLSSCRQNKVVQWQEETGYGLRVYFFHLNDRCDACNAIEDETRALMEAHFRPQIDSGIIFFKTFDIEKKEYRNIIEKYQVSYTTLLLIDRNGTKKDFTGTALNYANTNPEKFTALLKAEIENVIR